MNFMGFFSSTPGWNPNEFEYGFMQLHPRNINGTVKLHSKDPREVPDIHLGFFQNGDDEDLESILEAINFVRPIFHSLGNNTFTEHRPCAEGVECTDDWQRHYLHTQVYSHPAPMSLMLPQGSAPLTDYVAYGTVQFTFSVSPFE
ncbi:uncharacterized protein DNG_07972 [Cephalotrichum gorgonifer]|uniref:Uncharacterized protein n=1 Tax=Cephalotrichum gorgonifer TaxID=2041049 RepID=A0AAE8N2V6_9PEZI|nr:uncharacterized protein DNG_07972 [Cephalotrichum gorgonifer]